MHRDLSGMGFHDRAASKSDITKWNLKHTSSGDVFSGVKIRLLFQAIWWTSESASGRMVENSHEYTPKPCGKPSQNSRSCCSCKGWANTIINSMDEDGASVNFMCVKAGFSSCGYVMMGAESQQFVGCRDEARLVYFPHSVNWWL